MMAVYVGKNRDDLMTEKFIQTSSHYQPLFVVYYRILTKDFNRTGYFDVI